MNKKQVCDRECDLTSKIIHNHDFCAEIKTCDKCEEFMTECEC